MSAQIDTAPNRFRPANQPLIFTISDTGAAPNRYVVQVFEDGTEISKLYLTPNTNDVVHFDLNGVIKDRVKCDAKVRDLSVNIHENKTSPFTTGREGLKAYEVRVGSYDGSSATLNEDSAWVYLCDGAEQISSGLHPDYSLYYNKFGTDKGWLTDKSVANKIIHIFATETCAGVGCFFNDSITLLSDATKVNYSIYNRNVLLASETFTINAANGAQLPGATDYNQKITYMGIMPQNLNGYATTGKTPFDLPTWTHYKLTIQSVASATRSASLQVNRICEPLKHEKTQLAWTNTRGGWEYLVFEGRSEKTIKQESKEYVKALGDYDATTYTFLNSERETTPYQVTAKESYTLRSVELGIEDAHILQYAFRSDNVMMRLGSKGVWMPVIMDNKSWVAKETSSKIVDVSFSVTLSQAVRC